MKAAIKGKISVLGAAPILVAGCEAAAIASRPAARAPPSWQPPESVLLHPNRNLCGDRQDRLLSVYDMPAGPRSRWGSRASTPGPNISSTLEMDMPKVALSIALCVGLVFGFAQRAHAESKE